MSSDSSPQTPQEIQNALKQRLIKSGQYDKLLHLLSSRLNESGWEDNLRGAAKEKASAPSTSTKPPSALSLSQDLESQALASVPADVRKEIEDKLKAFVEGNTTADES